jgi:hypothetical protein
LPTGGLSSPMLQSIRTLMAGLIDYAGLYPPAKLAMGPSAENFARAKRGEHEWILGRFICPASRLREFSTAAAVMMPGTHGTSGYREHAETQEPWRVSAIIDGDLSANLETIAGFNGHHEREDNGLAVVDAIELKVPQADQIDAACETIPDELYPFFEIPGELISGGDCRGFVAALAGHMAAAKIRTGGVVPEAFPAPRDVAGAMAACQGAGVPFKATAGLHHPVRAEYPLTYEPNCPRGVMHGFVNVFIAAAMIREHGIDADRAAAILEERNAANFHFTPEGVRWNGLVLGDAELAEAREGFALSYGSCSFDEPVEDLRGLGLL